MDIIVGAEGDDAKLAVGGGVGAGVGCQEARGGALCCGHAVLGIGHGVVVAPVMLAIRIVTTVAAAFGAVHHGVGAVDDQYNSACVGLHAGAGAGLDGQGDVVGIFLALDGLSRFGQGDVGAVHIVGNGTGAALDPIATIVIVAIDGGGILLSPGGNCCAGNQGEHHAQNQHPGQSSANDVFHICYLLLGFTKSS